MIQEGDKTEQEITRALKRKPCRNAAFQLALWLTLSCTCLGMVQSTVSLGLSIKMIPRRNGHKPIRSRHFFTGDSTLFQNGKTDQENKVGKIPISLVCFVFLEKENEKKKEQKIPT